MPNLLNVILVMLVLGCVLGAILYIASVAFHVEVDEREEKVTAMLPGYNCGACGYPGCSGLAKALVDGETDTVSCKPCKPDQRAAIVDYLNNATGPNGEKVTVKSI